MQQQNHEIHLSLELWLKYGHLDTKLVHNINFDTFFKNIFCSFVISRKRFVRFQHYLKINFIPQ